MSKIQNIAIASDHAGFELKQALYLSLLKHEELKVTDLGCQDTNSVDYPVYAEKLAHEIKNKQGLGILICNSGIGMSIAANRFPWVHAALCFNTTMAQLSREHNNANILVLAAGFTSVDDAMAILETWLESKFKGDRHERRVKQIESLSIACGDQTNVQS